MSTLNLGYWIVSQKCRIIKICTDHELTGRRRNSDDVIRRHPMHRHRLGPYRRERFLHLNVSEYIGLLNDRIKWALSNAYQTYGLIKPLSNGPF